MSNSQPKRPSMLSVDSAFNILRNIDIELWSGDKWRLEDIRNDVNMLKFYLDNMLKQCEIEYGVTTAKPEPFFDPPVNKNKNWNCTPIVPDEIIEKMKKLNELNV